MLYRITCSDIRAGHMACNDLVAFWQLQAESSTISVGDWRRWTLGSRPCPACMYVLPTGLWGKLCIRNTGRWFMMENSEDTWLRSLSWSTGQLSMATRKNRTCGIQSVKSRRRCTHISIGEIENARCTSCPLNSPRCDGRDRKRSTGACRS